MKLNIDKIKNNLKTEFLGQNIIYREEIDSTQDEAKRIIDELEDGTYIVTDRQTRGKGTHGRVWYDQGYENICGTFVLKPNCNISKLENLTILIAECIVEAVNKLYNVELQIKYPNDLICNTKKIAGILTESVINNEVVKCIYIGIGMNVNQNVFDYEIKDIATSLKNEYKKEFSRETIISEFINIFERRYLDILK